ncbi:MAG: BatA domain-containing protein [Myxococcaceae bacterium]|nr:BatA domain-containing protein [Myxococcaceae bacterium]
MTFAHPWFLLGALAAFIPLLIHLFDRRRPRPVSFPAIAFVLKSQKRTASRLKLKRLILYALRTLFFLAIPIALARPEFVKSAAAVTAKGAAATVVVVDTSLAMRWRDGSSLFDEARKEAKAALADLLTEEPAAVLACTRAPAMTGPLSFEKSRLVTQVDELKATYEAVDLNRCLEVAARALDESPLANRRLVLVSALTANALRLESEPPVTTGPKGEKLKPEVVLRDVAKGRALPNRALLDVRAEPAPQVGAGAWQFTFTVRNFSAEAQRDVELTLKVDGEAVTKGFVELAPEGTTQKTLTWRFTKGGAAYVEGALTPDALADDDVRGLVVTVPKALKALVVNGEPNPLKVKDEAYFTDAALSAPGSPVRAVVRDADAAWKEDLSAYDVVMLLNVAPPPAEVTTRLEAFVAGGGGLFVSFGDRASDVDAFNAALGPVLPRKLRVVKTAVEPAQADASGRAARLAQLEAAHPVLSPFTGRAREGLVSTRLYRYALFESVSAGDVEVLATLDDGAPALLAMRKGKGRVLVFGSTVDRDWSDFPIRTAFLPFMQRAAAWLTGSLDEREQLRARVGETVTLPLAGDVAAVLVKSASGEERALTKDETGASATAGPLPEPGRYDVLDAAGRPVEALAFSATLDPAASDTTRHDVEAVTAWFGEEVVKLAEGESTEKKTPVWTWLLLVGALAFVGEGLLLRK